MQKELIIVVTAHRKFGIILVPNLITPSNGNSLYSVIDKASPINIKDANGYCSDYDSIIKLSDTIEDTYIARLFSKEPPSDFLRRVDATFIENRIRPHIEIRLKKMLELAIKLNLRIFYRDAKYSQIYTTDEISLSNLKSKVLFLFDRNENGIRYRIAIAHGDHYDKLKGKTAIVITDQNPCYVIINRTLYQLNDIDSKKFTPFLKNDFIHIKKETETVYFEKFIFNIVKNFRVRANGFKITYNNTLPKAILNTQIDLQGNVTICLKFQYGNKVILANNKERAFVELIRNNDDVEFIKQKRYYELELEYKTKLNELGLTTNDNVNYYIPNQNKISINNDINQQFYNDINNINTISEQLIEQGFEIRQSLNNKHYYLGKISLDVTTTQENDWFDLHGTVTLNGFTIPFTKFFKHILRDIHEYELPDGSIMILPNEWFANYQEILSVAQEINGKLLIKKQMFGLLHNSGIKSADVENLHNLFNIDSLPKETLPTELNATLRPYQLAGYYWLKLLKRNNFGGILADDMGLGKTIQALTLLLDSSTDEQIVEIRNTNSEPTLFDEIETNSKRPTSLIVMPLSLIHNWTNEAAKFAPNLKVLPYIGGNRTKNIQDFDNYDIVITTYGLLRNDAETLAHYPFYYAILDESQAIKNTTSKNYKSVISLHAKYKIALTGTPIENSLTDLWAQMNFINPGLLGSLQRFKTEYVSRIERDPNCEHAQQLQAMIEPFILRRTKQQVANDLPPKTEQIRICTMEKEQASLYETEKSVMRKTLIKKINDEGINKNTTLVLQSLMKLRQIACHPQMAGFSEPSAKFDEVTRILETIVAEKHKILIFSSFVSYLNIYKEHLTQNGTKHLMLTGETQNRDAIIKQFQEDDTIPVFLISLKAGGVGINLTAADYVFILDPWWNPSAENQAIDRAHRIGQTKNVFVYKFVTANTLEEKIIMLQNKKSDIANIFTSSNPLKDMTTEKLLELFD